MCVERRAHLDSTCTHDELEVDCKCSRSSQQLPFLMQATPICPVAALPHALERPRLFSTAALPRTPEQPSVCPAAALPCASNPGLPSGCPSSCKRPARLPFLACPSNSSLPFLAHRSAPDLASTVVLPRMPERSRPAQWLLFYVHQSAPKLPSAAALPRVTRLATSICQRHPMAVSSTTLERSLNDAAVEELRRMGFVIEE